MKNTALLGILAVLVLEAGCMMGPKYKRPTVDIPQQYRAPAPQQVAASLVAGQRTMVAGLPGSSSGTTDPHCHCGQL